MKPHPLAARDTRRPVAAEPQRPDDSLPDEPAPEPATVSYPAHRLNALCDGVFAIAMTLLALEVRIPDTVTDPARFRALLPEFAGQLGVYALAFFVIGRFWQSHHRVTAHVHHVDAVAIRRTIALLAGVSALPVATALLVRDGQFPDAVAVAAGLLALVSLLALWLYRRLAHPDLSDLTPGARRQLARRSAATSGIFLLAVPLAYLLPDSSYAPLVWWVLLLIQPGARGLDRLRTRSPEHSRRLQQSSGRPAPGDHRRPEVSSPQRTRR